MPEPRYKQTPIGKIPEDWEVVRLGDKEVAEIIMGQSPPSSTYNDSGSGLPFLQGKTEFGEIYPSPSIYCSKPIKIAELNDILLSVRAPVGDVNIAPFRCCIGRGLATIRPKKDRLNYLFLFYYLKLNGKKFEIISAGSTFRAIRKKDIENYLIPLPPIEEQRKIAEVLSTVDKAIEKVDEAIERTERLKKGLMQKLLTKGIGHNEFKDTEIGRIPKEWEVVRLEKLINIQSGKYFSYSEFCENGVRCLKIDNVGFGKLYWETTTFLPEEYLKKYPELVLRAGDIVVALNRPIINGKLKIAMLSHRDEPSILYQRVGRLIFKNKEISKRFLFYLLMGEYFKRELSKSLIGTDQPYIRTPILLKIKIPLPPLPEQQKIAEILSTVDKKLELLRKRKEKLERVKKGLMNDLLTGRKRVRMGVR